MKIKDVVVKYFGLDELSKSRFLEAYDNPFVDEIYKPHIDSNFRCRVALPDSMYEKFDRGWVSLNKVLPEIVAEYNITYKEFYKNKVLYNKNPLRIIKLIRSSFSGELSDYKIRSFIQRLNSYEESKFNEYENYCISNNTSLLDPINISKAVDLFIDRINELRFSKTKKIEVVLSLNRDDWFLSTTNESWRTCLSLESPSFASYWASLAGTVVDKNIALLYITNGDKKEYLGNVTDKVLSRSWVLLDKNSCMNTVKFYPSTLLEVSNIAKFFPIPIQEIDLSYESKYRIEPLKFKNGYTNYIYQDKTNPTDYNGKSFKLVRGDKGLYTFYKDKVFEGPIFDYSEGLKRLIDNSENDDILDFFSYPINCFHCDKLVSSKRAIRWSDYDNNTYCEDCFNSCKRQRDYDDDDNDNDNDYDYEEDPFHINTSTLILPRAIPSSFLEQGSIPST